MIRGLDSEHKVCGVTLEGITLNGEPVTEHDIQLYANEFAEDIHIK